MDDNRPQVAAPPSSELIVPVPAAQNLALSAPTADEEEAAGERMELSEQDKPDKEKKKKTKKERKKKENEQKEMAQRSEPEDNETIQSNWTDWFNEWWNYLFNEIFGSRGAERQET